MTLRERFNQALKDGMRARDQRRVSTLRLVLAALKDRDIANRSEDSREVIGDEEILSLLAKMIKQREESAQAFEAGGRPELAAEAGRMPKHPRPTAAARKMMMRLMILPPLLSWMP